MPSTNRINLSALRNALHDIESDLHAIEQDIISIEAAGDVGRARNDVVVAIGRITDALKHDVDRTAADAMGPVLCV